MKYEPSETLGADMPPRYCIDGKRVSRARFNEIRDSAKRLECFHTRGRQLPGGRIRRTNYSLATL